MFSGWKIVFAEIGRRLLQIVVVVIAEETVRRGFTAAFTDNENVHYEKPRPKKATVKNNK